MSFSERLNQLIERSGKSKRRIALDLGIQPLRLYRWASGQFQPENTALAELCDYFGVSPAWLLYGSTEITVPQSIVLEDGRVAIPQYDITAMCSPTDAGGQVATPELITLIKVTEEFLQEHCRGANPKFLHLVKASGDSMSPTVERGDLVIVDTSDTSVREDGVYLIRFGDALVIKRLQLMLNSIKVISDNRDLYDPFEITANEIEVIGKVYSSLNIRKH